MRLEHVCDMELSYQGAFSLVQPYGSQEGAGFGIGTGVASGEQVAGMVRWVNHPRRRSDGVMLPDAYAVITTEDGCEILCSWRGRANAGAGPQGKQVLAALFEAEDPRYHWLNDVVCVAEGRLHPETLRLQLRIYACVPDLAGG